jgi:pimeloyl-ACP methyl ester carboxylesterase
VATNLRVQQGGAGDRVLLLLHGLGATADVWNGWSALLAQRWDGRWIAPDLPGHGRSAALPLYSFASLAAAVAPLVGATDRVHILGHSLGGVVGLVLAAGGYGVTVESIVGLGIKVAWSDDDLRKAGALADRAPAMFTSRDEAAARHLRVSGLAGLLDPADAAVEAGLVRDGEQWRLAMDPRAFGVGAPDMAALLAATTATVTLARGELDPMNTDAQYLELGAPTVTLPGLGHNAHVENPAAVLALVG